MIAKNVRTLTHIYKTVFSFFFKDRGKRLYFYERVARCVCVCVFPFSFTFSFFIP